MLVVTLQVHTQSLRINYTCSCLGFSNIPINITLDFNFFFF